MSQDHDALTGLQWPGCPLRVSTLLFFDIETTGLRPDRGGRITEMAVVARDAVRFQWRCAAGHEHGEPALEQALPPLFDQLRTGVVVGHNLQFDLGFIAYEAERHGLEGPQLRYIDTLGLARRLADEVADYRLETLLGAFGLPVSDDLHTALADARATQSLFWRLVDEGGCETLADAGLRRLNWSTF